MIAPIVLGALLDVRPVIASQLACPSARDIESQLSVLLPDAAQPGTVVINATAEGLLVDLRPADPTFAAMRTLAVGADCEERARAVAVVISTWWPVRPKDVAASPRVVVAAEEKRDPVPRSTGLGLAAGAFASVTADGVSAGGRLEASWTGRAARGFGLRVSGSYAAAQGGAIGPGQAYWNRAAAEVGPIYSFGPGRLDVGVAVSRLSIHGSGFAVNQTSSGYAVGATVGGRVMWDRWRVSPWIEARGFLWPESQRMYVLDADTNIKTSRELPHGELQLAGGLALSFR